MVSNEIKDVNFNGGVIIRSPSKINITECTVNGRRGISTIIYPKIKGFTKRFIRNHKYGIKQ